MLISRVVVKDRDAPVLMHPVVVVYLIIGRVPQLDLPGQDRHGQGAAMANELAALIRTGRISRITQRQFQSEVGMKIGRFEVQVAKDPLFLAWVLVIDVIADTGLKVRGDLGGSSRQGRKSSGV